MHAVAEAKSAFRAITRDPDQPKLEWLRESVAPFFGLTFSQAKKIEYGEVKDLRASRLDHIREKLKQAQQRAERRLETSNGIKERLACLRSTQGGGDIVGGLRGAGVADLPSLGTGESGSREGGRPATVARSDER